MSVESTRSTSALPSLRVLRNGARLRSRDRSLSKALGSIPLSRLMLPGGIDIRGMEFLLRDPSDFGIYTKMRTATYKELVEAGCVISGSPATVREQLTALARDFRIGNLHAMLQFGSMPSTLAKQNIELFASEVLPALRPIWTDEFDHYWWPQRLGGKVSKAASRKLEVA